MFKNVGREIRIWAKVFLVAQMIPVVIGAFAAAGAIITVNEDFVFLGILAGILIVFIGYIFARLSCMMLYSWGEMVVRVTAIDEKLENMAPPVPPMPMPEAFYAPAPYQQPVDEPVNLPVDAVYSRPTAPVNDGNAHPQDWVCPVCGKQNPAIGKWCKNCGTKREG